MMSIEIKDEKKAKKRSPEGLLFKNRMVVLKLPFDLVYVVTPFRKGRTVHTFDERFRLLRFQT